MNRQLRAAAQCVGVTYIDAFDEDWTYSHRDGDVHPDQAGHDEITRRLTSDLRALAG